MSCFDFNDEDLEISLSLRINIMKLLRFLEWIFKNCFDFRNKYLEVVLILE